MAISGIGARSQLVQPNQPGVKPGHQPNNPANQNPGGDAVKVALAGMRSGFEGAGATATTYQAVGGKVAFKSAAAEEAQAQPSLMEQEMARIRDEERAKGEAPDMTQRV